MARRPGNEDDGRRTKLVKVFSSRCADGSRRPRQTHLTSTSSDRQTFLANFKKGLDGADVASLTEIGEHPLKISLETNKSLGLDRATVWHAQTLWDGGGLEALFLSKNHAVRKASWRVTQVFNSHHQHAGHC